MQQFGSENLFVSSKRDIALQKQLGCGSPGTQAVYFWRPLWLEKCQEAQIPCISPISCEKIYDIAVLLEVDRIHKKLFLGPRGPTLCIWGLRKVQKHYCHHFDNSRKFIYFTNTYEFIFNLKSWVIVATVMKFSIF